MVPEVAFVLRILSNLSSIFDRAKVVNLAPTLLLLSKRLARIAHAGHHPFALRLMNNTLRTLRTTEPVESVLAVKDIYTYGRVALEPGAAPPPPGWTELMLVTHHQEPVGRCFQR